MTQAALPQTGGSYTRETDGSLAKATPKPTKDAGKKPPKKEA